MSSIDIALVGCGLWGAHILRDLRQLGAKVHVVARSTESVARASDGGATSIVASIEELPDVAAAVVASPSVHHSAAVLAVHARLGPIPQFVEKPLCVSRRQLESLRSLAGHLWVMDKWRYHAGVSALAAIARERRYGRVVGLSSQRLSWGTVHEDANPVWHLMPHDLAIALEILGEIPAPSSVRVDFADGLIRGLACQLGADPWVSIEVSDRNEHYHREVRLYTEQAVVVLGDAYADSLGVYRSSPRTSARQAPVAALPFAANMPLHDELAAFLACVRGDGPPPRSSFADAAANVTTICSLLEMAGHAPDA